MSLIAGVYGVSNGCGSGELRPSTAEFSSYYARISSPPSNNYRRALDRAIAALLRSAVWGKCDAIYFHAAADTQTGKLNAKSTSFNCVDIGTTTFTAGVGYTGTGVAGTTDRLDTQFNPATAGGGYSQNSAHVSQWIGNDVVDANFTFGNTNTSFQPRFTGSLFTGRNQAGAASNAPSANSKGLWTANRTGSGSGGDLRLKNGASLTVSNGQSSGTLTSANFHILGASGGATTCTHIVSYTSFGAALTTSDAMFEYGVVLTYLTDIGYPNF